MLYLQSIVILYYQRIAHNKFTYQKKKQKELHIINLFQCPWPAFFVKWHMEDFGVSFLHFIELLVLCTNY